MHEPWQPPYRGVTELFTVCSVQLHPREKRGLRWQRRVELELEAKKLRGGIRRVELQLEVERSGGTRM